MTPIGRRFDENLSTVILGQETRLLAEIDDVVGWSSATCASDSIVAHSRSRL